MEVQLFLFSQRLQYQMKSRSLLFISLSLVSILFYSCTNNRSDEYHLISTDSSYNFHAIVNHDDILYATGGDVWNKSNLLTSIDGIEWSLDSLTNKSIFDLYSNEKTLYAVGNDGYIFSGQPNLKLSRTKYWGMLRGFTATSNDFVAVGGKDFNKGWIYKVNSELQVDTAHFFENEILDVLCDNSGTCIACGYGTILISNNSGLTWKRSTENGDYYNSIASNAQKDIFIVGYHGTIIKSKDNGESWEKLKNGHSPLADNKPFRTIKFNGNIGIIVGDNGLIWISQDNGTTWEDISIDTDIDLFDLDFFESDIICVSELGKIVTLTI